MKKITSNILFILIVIGVLFTSCNKDEGNSPLEHNTQKPGILTNVKVENFPGKAKISYTLPSDQDLLYVKAVYTLPATGKEMEVISSYYNNNLTVEGFSKEEEHIVKLYTVNRSEVVSDAVEVTIKPLEAPIWGVYRELSFSPSFGGFNIKSKNPSGADVVIELLSKNDFNEWEINDNSVYTSALNISSQIRGMNTLLYSFATTVRDRWLNYTDTVFFTVTPYYEVLITKSGYVGLYLPGDADYNPKTAMSGMWDGEIINWTNGGKSIYQTLASYTPSIPHVISFDIGKKVLVSRLKIWDYPEYFNGRTYYYIGNLKYFEIWGSPELSHELLPEVGTRDIGEIDPDNPWVLLQECEEIKPSGLPYGEMSDEDYNLAYAGFDWNTETDNMPEVRYIRIRCIKNWGGSTNMGIAELQVYGGYAN